MPSWDKSRLWTLFELRELFLKLHKFIQPFDSYLLFIIYLYVGYEISGIVDEVGPNAKTTLIKGQKVMLYQEEDIGFDDG